MTVVFCRKCQGLIEQGQVFCSRCYTPVKKPSLLRRIAESIAGWFAGFDGAGDGEIRTRGPISTTNVTIHKSERFTHHDRNTGEAREFSSMEDLPPEMRALFDAAMRRGGSLDMHTLSDDLAKMSGQTITKRITTGPDGSQKKEITVRGADGVERRYSSVDELPPEMRRLLDEFRSI